MMQNVFIRLILIRIDCIYYRIYSNYYSIKYTITNEYACLSAD